MTYSVKEIFYSLQGEGHRVGTPSVFCRFSGCNIWSGREQDRHRDSSKGECSLWCDTDFVGTDGNGGGRFQSAIELSKVVAQQWPSLGVGKPTVVCTGGEPLLQLDDPLVRAFHDAGLSVAVETNGTIPVPDDLDWVCVSPKASSRMVVTRGDELKVIWPQPIDLDALASMGFDHIFLQPISGNKSSERMCLDYCLSHPRWRLSLQTHKYLDIP